MFVMSCMSGDEMKAPWLTKHVPPCRTTGTVFPNQQANSTFRWQCLNSTRQTYFIRFILSCPSYHSTFCPGWSFRQLSRKGTAEIFHCERAGACAHRPWEVATSLRNALSCSSLLFESKNLLESKSRRHLATVYIDY